MSIRMLKLATDFHRSNASAIAGFSIFCHGKS